MPGVTHDKLDLLARLIGYDSVSARPNLALIGFIADYLSGFGIEGKILKDATGSKANLLATIGPQASGGLMLAGHTDVVPVEGQDWRSDPFTATRRDGRVYGRGACDMKGFISVALSLVPELARATLTRPVHLAFTYDEEIGCFGGAALAEIIARMDHPPGFCIVGEPTGMKVVSGHKGKLSIDGHVRGAECHSAYNDRGVNAVEIAAEIVARFRTLQKRLATEGTRDERFDPPFTTVHTGVMSGGVARNIVPRDCRFEVEIRNLPGDDPMDLLHAIEAETVEHLRVEMRRVSPDTSIRLDVQSCIPALAPGDPDEIVRQALRLSGTNRPGVVSFATEAGLYQRAGVPAIVCGPGDIAQAHRPDEYVAVEQLEKCEAFLRGMIRNQQSNPK
ncbi:MAG: acetylornithine deacetylase [Alphaproteobacteria bacterium]|nr:acetylornithine deacetylase [Alphaproteobacteria bacterium]